MEGNGSVNQKLELRRHKISIKINDSTSLEKIVRRRTPRIPSDRPMREAVVIMDSIGVQYLSIVDGEDIRGIITKREAEMAQRNGVDQDLKVGEFFSPQLIISGQASLREAARAMGTNGSRYALVKDERGAIIGHTCIDDILVLAPELIFEFSTLDDLARLSIESKVDISTLLRKKIKDL